MRYDQTTKKNAMQLRKEQLHNYQPHGLFPSETHLLLLVQKNKQNSKSRSTGSPSLICFFVFISKFVNKNVPDLLHILDLR